MGTPVSDEVTRTLASFRRELRGFLRFSELAALTESLSPQQHQALLAIHAAQDHAMTVGEIAENLYLKPHSASELVSRLEKSGLVIRSSKEGDGRVKVVSLTEKSIGILSKLSTEHQSELKRLRPLLIKLLSSL
ncbi:MarR family winged helix-turn-helix transcriptional regulator [Alloyangia pacifica]|uniref:MarR family winged helix-turn-helix transcriptional regulator n=1 Tax=Alloyangia pacifica TaxID=311180 RepID=UPI0031D7A9E6